MRGIGHALPVAMHHFFNRRAAVVIGLLIVAIWIAIVAIVVKAGGLDAWLARWIPPMIQPGIVALSHCTDDPANLPPPPVGPDGLPANFLHTCGSRIYDSHGREIRIAGLNWSGMEDSGYAPGGLGSRNWQDVLDQVAALGYNTIRLPFSTEGMESGGHIANVNFGLNPDLEGLTWLELTDHLIAGARQRGLKVILDRHQPTSGGRTTLWYTTQVPEDRWIADWRTLAARYAGNDTVIGIDLSNEPHGEATWGTGNLATDWRLAAERAGNAALSANPYLLVFVEGIETVGGDHFWWGGNLLGVSEAPVRLQIPNRVVYSPHDYGPAIAGQSWFWNPRFPANLPDEWDRHWGYIQRRGIAPVVVGEFGGWSLGNDADGKWQRALISYLHDRGIGAIVWSLNPNWDTGGIVGDDWQTVNPIKQAAYQAILAPPIGLDTPPALDSPRPAVRFRQDASGGSSGQVSFAFHVLNDGRTPLDLSRVEVRYWFQSGLVDPSQLRIDVNSGSLSGATVAADVVSANQGGQDHYVRVRFTQVSSTVSRYQQAGQVSIRFLKPNSAAVPPSSDYSYATPPPPTNDRFAEWNRVTAYVDGQLVWGREP